MKKKISALVSVFLCVFVLSSSIIYSQEIEDISAAVIGFLLRNPKTANKMKTGEKIALDIIGDLLKIESERKHQLKYASAGRNQITIKTNDGRQAQFVQNEQGKIFLLYDGVIYPIAQELVNQAKGLEEINIATLSPYDEQELEKRLLAHDSKNANGLKLIFTCKWHRELDGDGSFSFKEYYHKKRTFSIDEDFEILWVFYTERYDVATVYIKIYNESNGELMEDFKAVCTSANKKGALTLDNQSIPKGTLPTGIYIISAEIEFGSLSVSSGRKMLNEKIEIINR